jgi:hypothetical protein
MAGFDVSTRGARDFLTVSKHLKAAGETGCASSSTRRSPLAAKPLIPLVREAARRDLPKKGGLNERIAAKPYRVQARTGVNTAGVRIVGSKVDPRINDQGRIAHPVFGHKPNVVQYDPAAKGYFDQTLERAAPAGAGRGARRHAGLDFSAAARGDLGGEPLPRLRPDRPRHLRRRRRSRTSATPRRRPASRARRRAGCSPRA